MVKFQVIADASVAFVVEGEPVIEFEVATMGERGLPGDGESADLSDYWTAAQTQAAIETAASGKQASGDYATNSAVTTAIEGLVDGAPTAGNTLSKLYTLFQTLNALVTGSTADGDSVVDTVQEILSIFSTYPEGTDIAQALAGKINTTAIVNTLTETGADKVLDARQGKALKDLIDALTTTVAGKAAASHNHSADDITSGTFSAARIPDLSGTYAPATHTHEHIKNLDSRLKLYEALGSVIKAETPYSITTAQALASGTARFQAFYLSQAATLTGVKWFQSVAGAYTASNFNGVGLYTYLNGTLTLVASSANDGDIWKATANTLPAKAFSTPYAAQPGVYFIAFLYSSSAQTTAPSIGAGASNVASTVTKMDFTNGAQISGAVGSQTSLPASVAASSFLTSSANYWGGVY